MKNPKNTGTELCCRVSLGFIVLCLGRFTYIPHSFMQLVLDKLLACHFGRLRQTHYVQQCGCNVGKYAVAYLCICIFGHIHAGNGVERMGCVGSAVFI